MRWVVHVTWWASCAGNFGRRKLTDKFAWHKAYGRSTVPAPARAVGYIIWDHTDAEGENAFPGIANLIEYTNQSRSAVIRNLRTNVDRGWLQQVSSGSRSGKAGVASVYRLSYPEHVSPMEPATPPNQVSSMEPASMDQVSPVTPDTPNQVSPVAQPGVISDTPTDPVSNPESSDPLYRSVLEETQARTAQRQAQPSRPLPGWVTDTHVTDAEAKSLDLPAFVARTEREARYSKPNYLSTLIQRASRVIAGGLVEE